MATSERLSFHSNYESHLCVVVNNIRVSFSSIHFNVLVDTPVVNSSVLSLYFAASPFLCVTYTIECMSVRHRRLNTFSKQYSIQFKKEQNKAPSGILKFDYFKRKYIFYKTKNNNTKNHHHFFNADKYKLPIHRFNQVKRREAHLLQDDRKITKRKQQ